VVEGGGLENRITSNRDGGSNPSPSVAPPTLLPKQEYKKTNAPPTFLPKQEYKKTNAPPTFLPKQEYKKTNAPPPTSPNKNLRGRAHTLNQPSKKKIFRITDALLNPLPNPEIKESERALYP
jgi:hypothetical protein